jgi:hypothetical protein
MQSAILIKGRLTGPTTVELDEPVAQASAEVEVLIRPALGGTANVPRESVLDFLRRLPPGTRTKEDIDQQIREERDSWGDR